MSLIHTTAVRSAVAIVAAGLLCAAPAARAAAGDDYESQSRTVSTHGLDLGSAAGRATLHRRIMTAAASVCRSDDTRHLRAAGDYEQCREQAVIDASAQAMVLIARASAPTMAVAEAGTSRP